MQTTSVLRKFVDFDAFFAEDRDDCRVVFLEVHPLNLHSDEVFALFVVLKDLVADVHRFVAEETLFVAL